MTTVDLVYSPDCPNVTLARGNLLLALSRSGVVPKWSEHRIGDPEAPLHTRGYGSPTILVNGRDVAGRPPSAETSCRVYQSAGTLVGAPPAEQIVAALAATTQSMVLVKKRGGWRSSLATLPGISLAVLPKVACPACWPAYAGVLTSLGLGFLMEVRWLMPITAAFLVLAVFALGFRAGRRRGLGPLFLGVCAAGAVLAGKFVLGSDLAMYAGLAFLVTASIWNTWPRRVAPECRACTPT